MNEIILRSESDREPVSDDRLKMIFNYVAGITAEVLGFVLAIIVVLCMAGVI